MHGLLEPIRACLLDLVRVLTDTASVHKTAWNAMFNSYLRQQSERRGEKFVPFDPGADIAMTDLAELLSR